MALSGTLDTFALPDVLRLLASTEKSGRLRVSGNRGSGSVWVMSGEVVASELTTLNSLDPSAVDVVFGLLRFDAGSFTFEADAVAPNAGDGQTMESILTAAEHMLVEWKAIEAVVPSLEVWVGLQPELNGPDVMVDAMRWRCIAIVGSGVQVGLVAEELGLNEVEACRLVKELIELGLLETVEAPAGAPVMPEPIVEEIPEIDVTPEVEVSHDDPVDEPVAEPEPEMAEADDIEPMADEPAVEIADEHDGDDDGGEPADEPVPSTVPSLAQLASTDEVGQSAGNGHHDAGAGLFAEASDADAAADDLNPAEMARQLANLSPKAAKAVAAAAKASTEAEREAALAAVEAEDGTVNRGLLLKFLGSVDS